MKLIILLLVSCMIMNVSSFMSSSSMNGYVSKIYRGKNFNMNLTPLDRTTGYYHNHNHHHHHNHYHYHHNHHLHYQQELHGYWYFR
jgi:hypothetical protein